MRIKSIIPIIACAQIALVILGACAAKPCPEPHVVEVIVDAGPPQPAPRPDDETTVIVTLPDGGSIVLEGEPFDAVGGYSSPDCAAACANLARVRDAAHPNGCPEAKAAAGEDSCYVVCRRAAATNGRIDFKPRCIAAAKTIATLRACGTYRC